MRHYPNERAERFAVHLLDDPGVDAPAAAAIAAGYSPRTASRIGWLVDVLMVCDDLDDPRHAAAFGLLREACADA